VLPLANLLGEKGLPLLLDVGEKAGKLEKGILDEREEKREENVNRNENREREDRLGASLKRVRVFFLFDGSRFETESGRRPLGFGFGGNGVGDSLCG
jgi:hypothetical protein